MSGSGSDDEIDDALFHDRLADYECGFIAGVLAVRGIVNPTVDDFRNASDVLEAMRQRLKGRQ